MEMQVNQMCKEKPFPVVKEILYLAQTFNLEKACGQPFHFFTAEDELMYTPFCDDFGPVNLEQVFRFYKLVENERNTHPDNRLVLVTDSHIRTMTNAVFLLGTYLILARNIGPNSLFDLFRPLLPHLEMYRDATFWEETFRLTLFDCWNAFIHSKVLGWLDLIDMDLYAHYDNPLEGDLHCVVPGKLIAFKGPRSLSDGRLFQDNAGYRTFSPAFYCDAPFADMGVTTVIRLNESEYNAGDFTKAGITCIDLEFEDCTVPPPRIVADFLFAVSRAAGAVAVHCKAGLGRTGTLIAIYMMAHHGFTARAAIGWLRIVRPGSVIGDQQDYLCRVEAYDGDIISACTAAAEAYENADAGRARALADQVADALSCPERTAGRAAKAAKCGAVP